ncbi:MAG: hypothetical protein WC777_00625 [Candidatus Gracilibacteria bacterium]|jgi:type II secretory pathway pseudopilin PulG
MRYAKAAGSLIEVIVAVTVIVLSTAAALSVLRSSTEGIEVISETTIARNLSYEAFDALLNIRDTNYLLFSSNPDGCWDKLDATDVTLCDTANAITAGRNYYLERDLMGASLLKWHLLEIETVNSNEGYLDLVTVDLDEDGTMDTQLYAQTGATIVGDMLSIQEDHVGIFKRTIHIDSVSTDEAGVPNSYEATVTVSWDQNGIEKSLSLTQSIAHIY